VGNTDQKYIVLYSIKDGTEMVRTIDIVTGELKGFAINGGNWSNEDEIYDFLTIRMASGDEF